MSTELNDWTREEVYYISERAFHLYRQGNLQAAEILFTGLTEIDRDDVYALRALAAIQIALGDWGKALRYLTEALKKDQTSSDLLAMRAETLFAMGDQNGAQQDFQLLVKRVDGREAARRLKALFDKRNNLTQRR
jgi:predicted Zn-dependent protease